MTVQSDAQLPSNRPYTNMYHNKKIEEKLAEQKHLPSMAVLPSQAVLPGQVEIEKQRSTVHPHAVLSDNEKQKLLPGNSNKKISELVARLKRI